MRHVIPHELQTDSSRSSAKTIGVEPHPTHGASESAFANKAASDSITFTIDPAPRIAATPCHSSTPTKQNL